MKFLSGLLSAVGLLHVTAAGIASVNVREDRQPDSQTIAAYEKTEALATEIIEIVAKGLEQLDKILCAVFVSAIKEVAEIGLMFVPGGAAVKGAGKAIQYAKSAYENGMDLVDAPDSMMGGVTPTGCLLKDKKKCKNLDKKGDPKDGKEIHKGEKSPDKKKDDEEKKKKKGDEEKKKKGDEDKKDKDEEKKKKEEEEKNKSCKVKRAPYVPPPKRKVNKFDEEEKRTTRECIGGKDQDVVHITRTHSDIGFYVQERKDMPKIVYKKEHTQACYHYRYVSELFPQSRRCKFTDMGIYTTRSVMSRYAKTKDMTEWTCQQTATSNNKGWGHDGFATERWGSTALAKIPGTSGKKAKVESGSTGSPGPTASSTASGSWRTASQKFGADKKPAWNGCERDEFPPRYFWPGDDKAPKTMRQLVRLLPKDQNGGAGQLWNGFCNDNNAKSTTKPPAKPEETYVVSAHLKSVRGKEEKDVKKGTATSITTVTVSTLRAIFSISDLQGLKPNSDGLDENPCYPKDLIDDPGWALLTDDEWYKNEGKQHAAKTAEYRKSSTKAQVDAARAEIAADAGRKGKLWKNWVGDGDGQIRAELWGVLPSLPKFPKPQGVTKKRRIDDMASQNNNETLALENRDSDDLEGDGGHEVDLDSLTDEELAQWLAQYEEVARRMYALAEEELTPTSPPVVEAQATITATKGDEPVQGEPAAVGPEVTNVLPLPKYWYGKVLVIYFG
ncbi:hypothetical protein PG993_012879 [Apiospora rasikravindrae]|uniref:Uncharacterized protein n=1 Tax=Apiospora rasikravindrae TaxID=990691 RepID=A0ABR1RW13_9PEZI